MPLQFSTKRSTIIHGEALAALSALPGAHVDAVITDPPYSSGGQYRSDRTADPLVKYIQSDSAAKDLATFAGDNRDQRAYLKWCAIWLGEALRATKPGGALLVFCDWRQLPVTTDAVQIGGWTWRGIVPWHKPMNRPQPGRFSAACEYVVWATNGHRPLDYTEGYLQGFYSVSAPQDRSHPTEKPLGLMRHLVKIAPVGGLVLDPFVGSGTTLAAALLERRRALGIEITEHYAQAAGTRLAKIEDATTATSETATLFDHADPVTTSAMGGRCSVAPLQPHQRAPA